MAHAQRFEQLQQYVAGGLNLAEQLLGCAQQAADVVQEALTKALVTEHYPQQTLQVRAWFYQVIRNACLDQLRQRSKYVDDEAALEQQTWQDLGEQAVMVKQNRTAVHDALARLPLQQRDVVLLCDVHDLSYQEIATVIQCEVGTVMSRLHRARTRLRELLTPVIETN